MEDSLRTYASPGVCSGGLCAYTPSDRVCELGCEAGRCTGCEPEWDVTPVERAIGDASLAVDADGTLHHAYMSFDGENAALQHATLTDAGTWETEEVDTAEARGGFTAMVIEPGGTVHIIYIGAEGLRHAERAPGGEWVLETVGSVTSNGSIALDGAGGLHLAYLGSSSLRYAVRPAGGEWTTSTIDPDGSVAASIHVDSDDRVHVAYLGELPSLEFEVRYATLTGEGAWEVDGLFEILYGAWAIDLTTDPAGNTHIVYSAGGAGLNYVRRPAGGAWGASMEIAEAQWPDSSIVSDAAGGLHVSFSLEDDTAGYAHLAPGGAWTVEPIGPANAIHSTIALANDGAIYVTFNDSVSLDGWDQRRYYGFRPPCE